MTKLDDLDDYCPFEDHLVQFHLHSGCVAVFAGIRNGRSWRRDYPVMGWALRVRTWTNGTKTETTILPLTISGVGLEPLATDDFPYEDGSPDLRPSQFVAFLPPDPTVEQRADVDRQVAERIAQRREFDMAMKEVTS